MIPAETPTITIERANQIIDYLNYQLDQQGFKRRFPYF